MPEKLLCTEKILFSTKRTIIAWMKKLKRKIKENKKKEKVWYDLKSCSRKVEAQPLSYWDIGIMGATNQYYSNVSSIFWALPKDGNSKMISCYWDFERVILSIYN